MINPAPTTVITQGPYGFGILFFSKMIDNAKIFYCPSVDPNNTTDGYNTFSSTPTWPSIPANYPSGQNQYVRCNYNYYPQPKTTQTFNDPNYGNVTLPVLMAKSVTFHSPTGGGGQSAISEPVQLKFTALDVNKAMCVDVMNRIMSLSHKTSGYPGGVNALFADGHATFVVVGGNNLKGSFQPFDPNLWDPLDANNSGPGNDPTGFRIIMNGFEP